MKPHKLHQLTLTALTALGMTALMCSAALAQDVDRTVLPLPDPVFNGKIEMSLKDSTPNWPEAVKPPKGAPNVLLIMGDDIGFGHMGSFGGPANTPNFDRLAQEGLRFTEFGALPSQRSSY